MTRFAPAAPSWLSLTPFDARASWTGSFSEAPDVPIRIEAAAWRGRPVYFQVIGPWSRPSRIQPQADDRRPTARPGLTSWVSSPSSSASRWSLRGATSARAEPMSGARRGRARSVFGCALVDWACRANHVPDVTAELTSFSWAISAAAFSGRRFLGALRGARASRPATMAPEHDQLEPPAQRRHPASARRRTSARRRGVRRGLHHPLPGPLSSGGIGYSPLALMSVVDIPRMVAMFIIPVIGSSQLAMGMFFVFFLLRVVLRRLWLAAIVFTVAGRASRDARLSPAPARRSARSRSVRPHHLHPEPVRRPADARRHLREHDAAGFSADDESRDVVRGEYALRVRQHRRAHRVRAVHGDRPATARRGRLSRASLARRAITASLQRTRPRLAAPARTTGARPASNPASTALEAASRGQASNLRSRACTS